MRSSYVSVVALAGLSLVGVSGPALAQDAEAREDGLCRQWGALPGSPAYFECRATLARERGEQGPRGAPVQPEQNVSDGMALSLCERHARGVAPYPIERLASSFVYPGREKRASLSFKVM